MRQEIDFDGLFLGLNHLPRFASWIFHPGMLFNTRRKWWTDQGSRGSRHEGIDFCLFMDLDGTARALEPGTTVPAAADGTVAAIRPDLLGSSVVLRHDSPRADDPLLFSIYAHVEVRDGIEPGRPVRSGEPLASIAAFRRRVPGMLCHLHLSFARMDPTCDAIPDWDMINARSGLELLDPLTLLRLRYRVEEIASASRSGLAG